MNRLRRRLLDTLDLTDIGLEPGYDPNTPEALAYAKDLEGQAERILIKNTSAYWLELFENKRDPRRSGPVRGGVVRRPADPSQRSGE